MVSHRLMAALLGGAVATTGAVPALAVSAEHFELTSAQYNLLYPKVAAMRAALAAKVASKDKDIKADRAAIADFYAARGYETYWIADGHFTGKAVSLIERINRAGEDGLDPDDYVTPASDFGMSNLPSPGEIAAAEIALAHVALAFARHASVGRVEPLRISRSITLKPKKPNAVEVLRALAISPRPDATLGSYNPPHEGYRRLKAKLAEIRGQDETINRPEPIPSGRTLKLGMRDDRVALIRERIGAAIPDIDADVYDKDFKKSVRAFQRKAGLHGDGVIGPRTLGAINGNLEEDKEGVVLANMEHWRWMPRDFGEFHVRVNIPEFRVRVMWNGNVHHTTRVIVGKYKNQTPIFSDEMEHFIVNPYWNVPLSIASKEMLPGILKDPQGYFARRNYEVLTTVKGRVRTVNPGTLDWSTINLRKLHIRQRPGRGNALGRIKFMFPNEHSVYLHDTPTKSLFKRDYRAFSHGCVRVYQPLKFADSLLANEPQLNASRLEAMFGGEERKIPLSRRIPVHLTYFTGWVDDDGRLQTRKDLYRHYTRLNKCLAVRKKGGICNVPPKPKKYSPPPPDARVADNNGYEQPGLFGTVRIFRNSNKTRRNHQPYNHFNRGYETFNR